MMDDRWQTGGAGAGNWGPGEVTETLGDMMVGTVHARNLRGNTGVGRGADCARRRNFSESVAKAAAWSDWTVDNGVAGSGCCKACTRFCAKMTAASEDEVVGMKMFWGNNSTVRAMHSLQVRDTKMLW